MTRQDFIDAIIDTIRKHPEGISWYGVARNLAYGEYLNFTNQLNDVFAEVEKNEFIYLKDGRYFAK
ncbi:MAG: hypothetical protein ACK5NT_07860 [Pyrinomonadaceae bacterium]